jgi:hypothetical protein
VDPDVFADPTTDRDQERPAADPVTEELRTVDPSRSRSTHE